MKAGTHRHRKTGRLRLLLGCSQLEVIAHLELLFQATAEEAPDGAIGVLWDCEIAERLLWTGEDPAVLVAALVDSGWLDRDDVHRLLVHDWADHIPDYVGKRNARAGVEIATPTTWSGAQSDATPSAPHGHRAVTERWTGRGGEGPGREGRGGEGQGGVGGQVEPSPAEVLVETWTTLRAHAIELGADPARWRAKPTKPQRQALQARLREGRTVDELKAAAIGYVRDRGLEPREGSDFDPLQHLKAETLYRPSKLDGYIQAADARGAGGRLPRSADEEVERRRAARRARSSSGGPDEAGQVLADLFGPARPRDGNGRARTVRPNGGQNARTEGAR